MKRHLFDSPSVLLILIFCVMIVGPESQGQERPYAISGTLMTQNGVVSHGTILIARGTIQALGAHIPIAPGTPVVETHGVVFAGLIDTHNHLLWNVFPRWRPGRTFGDRYEWQALNDYVAHLGSPERQMVDSGGGCDMERYAEVKAMVGGATSVVGSYSPTPTEPNRNSCDRGLARNLDRFSGLYSSEINAEPLGYEVFPFEVPYFDMQAIRDALNSGKLKALLIHVSEGRDASAAREFRMLIASGLLRQGVTLIHGIALGPREFEEMSRNGVGLVWSPHSDLTLYGTTTDVADAKAAGVTMAIAPDWSLTGSNGMLEELHYAYKWNSEQFQSAFTPADFLDMATRNPALLAAASDKIGTLAPGYAADIIVLPIRGNSPLASLVNSKPGSIRLVVVGGEPMLGDPDLMRELIQTKDPDSLQVCGFTKQLNIKADIGGQTWTMLVDRLATEMHRFGSSLADLADCDDTN